MINLARAAAVTLFVATAVARPAQNVEIRRTRVADGVYMLEGQGGNIGLSVGDDGVFMIDDQYAPLTPKILEAVAALTDAPVRFVVNTHWHGDHTGGNENLGKAGAVIVAHENVRARMSTEQFVAAFNMRTPAAPEVALPVITFTDSVTFHWNDDELRVFHVEHAHTDGDAVIHFRKANVVHAGDTFFNGMYPFIDAGTGGTVDGMIAATDRILAIANDRTRIIPGHGPLSDRAGLREFRGMLVTVRDRVRRLMDEGQSKEEIIAAKPTRDLDATWGNGFLEPDVWIGIVVDAMGE